MNLDVIGWTSIWHDRCAATKRVQYAVNLTPREKDKLLVSVAAMVAERRLSVASSSTTPKRWR